MRIFEKGRTYIPISEVKGNDLSPYTIEIEGIKVIAEADYNYLVQNGRVEGNIELTKVETLEAAVEDIKRLAPLKKIFLSGLGESEEQINARIAEETKEKIEKAIQKLSDDSDNSRYLNQVDIIQRFEDKAKEYLGPEYDLQYLTEMNQGRAGITCYLVGENTFYQIDLSEDQFEDLDTFHITEDGFSFLDTMEGEVVDCKKEDLGRDFRGYSVSENIFWCLCNLPVKNDFVDEVDYHSGCINMSANTELVMKYLNPKTFPHRMFVNGVVDLKKEIIVPEFHEDMKEACKDESSCNP